MSNEELIKAIEVYIQHLNEQGAGIKGHKLNRIVDRIYAYLKQLGV